MAMTPINKERKCDFCNTRELDIRKVGNYMVVLSKIEVDGEMRLACQGCKRNAKQITHIQVKPPRKNWLKKIFH